MTTLRQAAQQVLKSIAGYRRHSGETQPCDAEISLLDALAQEPAEIDAQRDALLDVAKKLVAWLETEDDHGNTTFWQRVEMREQVDALARAAIAVCENGTKPIEGQKNLRVTAEHVLAALEAIARSNNTTWQSQRAKIEFDALKSALAHERSESETCTWWQDGDSDSDTYSTSCGRYFRITDGTPEDNKMAHCCYCGKRLMQELIAEEDTNPTEGESK